LSVEKHFIHDLQDKQTADQPNGVGTIYEGVILPALSDISEPGA
jgi:hypothetical protein